MNTKEKNYTIVDCEIKPYTTKQMTTLYGVSDKTFRKWLTPFRELIGQKHGLFFTIEQVKVIFEKLGTPGHMIPAS